MLGSHGRSRWPAGFSLAGLWWAAGADGRGEHRRRSVPALHLGWAPAGPAVYVSSSQKVIWKSCPGVWTDLHSRAVDKVNSVFGFDTPPFDWGLMVNFGEFFAGLSQYYFFQNDPPRRYAKQFFPQAFAFLEEFYGILTPKETDRPGYVQYVTASGIPLPWLVPGGFTYEHSTFGYSIELLPGWKVEREGVHDVLLSGRNWPWPEIRIEYTILPDGTGAGDPLVRLAESRIEEWEQSTLEWDKTEVRSFERVLSGEPTSAIRDSVQAQLRRWSARTERPEGSGPSTIDSSTGPTSVQAKDFTGFLALRRVAEEGQGTAHRRVLEVGPILPQLSERVSRWGEGACHHEGS